LLHDVIDGNVILGNSIFANGDAMFLQSFSNATTKKSAEQGVRLRPPPRKMTARTLRSSPIRRW
jgi:hypothetical protein